MDVQQGHGRRVFFHRFPDDDLYRRIAAEAKAAERSVTAEINFRLKKSLEHKLDEART